MVDTGDLDDEFLGSGHSVWQFKKSFPSDTTRVKEKSALERELEKPGVQDAFFRGSGYTLVVGVQRSPGGPHGQIAKQQRLEELARKAGCAGPIRLLVADHIATWTSQDPAALLSIRPDVRGLRDAQTELSSHRHGSAFEPDPARTAILKDIQTRLFGTDPVVSHIRIQGQAGVGKSRLALEAVARFGAPEATFYTNETPPGELFAWITAQPGAHLTLIVDECELEEARRYAEKAELAGGKVRLITVGPGSSRGLDIHVLAPIAQEAVERIIRRETYLPEERARWIARKTRGYIKLAVLVAKAVANGTTNIAQLSSDSDISTLVQNLLAATEREREALRGVALLSRVGIEGEVDAEGNAIASFLDMGWNEFRSALSRARQQGIVVKRGRYLYVSPELLATWLAGEVWRGQPERIVEFLLSLPSQSARMAFSQRLASLRDVPEVERVVAEDLLGPTGPFRSIEDLSDNLASRLFSTLAKGHTQAAITSLSRIIGAVTDDDLREFRTGRQEVVWTLRSLLERRTTFAAAARLLRRLAEIENEHYYSNSATDYWNSAFLTLLGQTEVPPLERLPLIDEALNSNRRAVRLLGISALRAALETRESAVIERGEESVPPTYWRPSSDAEIVEIKRQTFGRLLPLLTDEDAVLAGKAREVLRSRARGLAEIGLGDSVLAGFRRLHVTPEAERRETWQALREIIGLRAAPLTSTQRAGFETLASEYYDDSLIDRMRRYLGPGSFANWDWDDIKGHRQDEIITALADEANTSDEWLGLLPWLFSGNAHQVYRFAFHLGEIDSERKWLDKLVEVGVGAADPRPLTVYLAGWASLGEAEQAKVEGLLDHWAEDPDFVGLVADATIRGAPGERAVRRLLGLVSKTLVPVSILGWLRTWNQLRALPVEVIQEVIDALLVDGSSDAIQAGIAFTVGLKDQYDGVIPDELLEPVWRLLESPGGWTEDGHTDLLWQALAKDLVERDPLRMVDLIARMYRQIAPQFQDERLKVLLQAIDQKPRAVLERLSSELILPSQQFRFRWALKDLGFFEHLDPGLVDEWVWHNGERAVEAMIEAINVREGELSPLVRFLLNNFYDRTDGPLASQFIAGSWTGSEAAYLRQKLETARMWSQDSDSSVRKWAANLCTYLEAEIARATLREEEEWWGRE